MLLFPHQPTGRQTIVDTAAPTTTPRASWSKGRLIGKKAPLKLREVWRVRTRLQICLAGTSSPTCRSVVGSTPCACYMALATSIQRLAIPTRRPPRSRAPRCRATAETSGGVVARNPWRLRGPDASVGLFARPLPALERYPGAEMGVRLVGSTVSLADSLDLKWHPRLPGSSAGQSSRTTCSR